MPKNLTPQDKWETEFQVPLPGEPRNIGPLEALFQKLLNRTERLKHRIAEILGLPWDATPPDTLSGLHSRVQTIESSQGGTTLSAHRAAPVLDHPDGSVTAAKLADGAVTTSKIANNAVTNAKIAANAVQSLQIADGAVTAEKLADGAVTAEKLADGAVTAAKLAPGVVPSLMDFANRFVVQASVGDGTVQLDGDAILIIAATAVNVPPGKALYLKRLRFYLGQEELRAVVVGMGTFYYTSNSDYGDIAVDVAMDVLITTPMIVFIGVYNSSEGIITLIPGSSIWAEFEIR